MLSGAACGLLPLLLLLGGVAVALAMKTFSRLALLALGVVPLLVTLLDTITKVILAPWLPSCLSAGLLCSLVSAAAPDPAPRRVAVCR